MPRAQLVRYIALWLALAVGGEIYLAFAYAAHAGWLGSIGGIAVAPVSVLVVEETSERNKLTPGQREIIASHASDSFLAWIKTHGEKDPAGNYRIVDKDDSMSQDEAKWQTAFQAKGPTVPWLVVTRGGKVLLSESMPAEAAETMKTLKRFGGQ